MTLPPFAYHEPVTVAEASQMLQAFGDTAALLAGGTDLLVKMKNRLLRPQSLVSLVELEEMQEIKRSSHQTSIGACCSVARIAASQDIRSVFPALAQAAGQIGSPAVRNLATLGGNIVTASPAGDLPAALIAYNAQARLQGADTERSIALEKIFRGPGVTDLAREEILVEILLDHPPKSSAAGFFKLGTRKTLQISVVNGACALRLDPRKGTIASARIVLGAVGPTHLRAPAAEDLLLGEQPRVELFEAAGREAALECRPIDDLRGSGAYRRDMVHMMVSRTLQNAWEDLTNSVIKGQL